MAMMSSFNTSKHNYHSIVNVNDEEFIPLTTKRENLSEKRPWYLWIPVFLVGVFAAAIFFVLSSSTTITTDSSAVEDSQLTISSSPDQVDQWSVWKEDLVAAAQHFPSDIREAWQKNEHNNNEQQAVLLQQTWESPQQAQAWWQDISSSAQEFFKNVQQSTKEDATKAGEWLNSAENATQEWTQDEANKAGKWLDKEGQATKEWAGDASEKAKEWGDEAGKATKEWAGEAEEEAGDLWGHAVNKTEELAHDTSKEAKHFGKHAAKNTKEWTENAENTTGTWLHEGSEKAGDWFKDEETKASHAASTAGHWIGKEAKNTGQWFKKEGNATLHGAEEAGEWIGDETKRAANSTEEWFAKESNVTEKWITHEARASAAWFKKEAQDTGRWFRKEGNATGRWFKKEANATENFVATESNRTVHWFEADAEAVRIWWNNITHRDRVYDESLMYFNTTAAFALLVTGYGWYDSSRDFFAYQQGLDTQENQAYCAVASSAAVINSFRGRLDLPMDPIYAPFPYATQNNLFNECTDLNVAVHNDTFDGIRHAPGGLNLDQSKALLECNLPSTGWTVEAHHVDPNVVSLDDMRKDLVLSLMSPASRVIVNYNRAAANQEGGGHFSPLGGYSHERDSFLLMDVAKYKYPFVWIPAPVLYRSMMTVDACGSIHSPSTKQVELKSSHPELAEPKSSRDLSKAVSKLGCKAAFRGYLIVKQL